MKTKPKVPAKFHGYSLNFGSDLPEDSNIMLGIGHIPTRKGLCLYYSQRTRYVSEIEPLAYFKNEASARMAQELLDWFVLKIEPACFNPARQPLPPTDGAHAGEK